MSELGFDVLLLVVCAALVLMLLAVVDAGLWLVMGALRLLSSLVGRPHHEVLPRDTDREVDELVIHHLRGGEERRRPTPLRPRQ